MVTNKFETRFTAVDQVTPVAEKVDASFGKMQMRIQQLETRLHSLGERGKKTDLDAPLSKFGKGAKIAAENVGQIIPPFRLLTSVGSIAGLGMLARGVGELATNAGLAAINLQRASRYSNTSAQNFQELIAAGELKHLPEGAVESGMQRLFQKGEEGRLNSDPLARAAYLTKIKPGAKEFPMKDGNVDPMQLLYDISTFLKTTKLAPNDQRRVLDAFGITELRPLIEGGPGELDRLRARAKSNGAVISEQGLLDRVDVANEITEVKQKVRGFGSAQYSGVLAGRQGRYDGSMGSAFTFGGRTLLDSFLFPDSGYDPNSPAERITTPGLITKVQEMSARLSQYQGSGRNTLSAIAQAEGFEDPASAAADLARLTGISSVDDQINLGDVGTQATLISALRKERGEFAPDPAQLVDAVREAVRSTPVTVKVDIDVNGPARVRATDSSGNPLPARINHTAPSSVGE